MKKTFLSIVWLLLLNLALPLQAVLLREEFQEAQTGDYLVAAQAKNYTLLHILNKTGNRLLIEEITVPAKLVSTQNWQDWISKGAPNNTSWVMYEIDLNTGKMVAYFSFTENRWLEMDKGDNFLSTLLVLKLQKTEEVDRKRVGPRPLSGYIDRRPTWHPCLILNGEKQNVLFDSWYTIWPQDGTDLAGKHIDIYLPANKGNYLSYFPYWIEVQGAGSKAKLRIIDSGRNLVSPKTGLPKKKV